MIGESLFNYKALEVLRQEDFIHYRKQFKVIQECKGDQLKIVTEHPELYEIQDSIVFVSIGLDTLILYLCEGTFNRTLINVLKAQQGDTLELSESVLYDDLVTKIKDEDVFDLMDFLPDYMQNIGLPNEMVKKWVDYCKQRIEEIKDFINNKKWL